MKPDNFREKRDRAMLAVAYSAMLRRSELLAQEMSDLAFGPDGSGTVTVKFFKTDQSAEGHVRYLALFAVSPLNEWLNEAGIDVGCIFGAVLPVGAVAVKALNDHEVARIFKRVAGRLEAIRRALAARRYGKMLPHLVH